MPWDNMYRGDLALIYLHLNPLRLSAPVIYRGGPDSNSFSRVRQMAPRRAARGNRVCSGGHVSGEVCDWIVVVGAHNHRYANGALARNVIRAERVGGCTRNGDSGGPIYYFDSGGRLVARGILSGGGTTRSGKCFLIFTDIWEAYYGFPGYLKTQ
jgi:hypothetical protein